MPTKQTEMSVEEALRELREIFPQGCHSVEYRCDEYVVKADTLLAAGTTLDEAMAQIRAWRNNNAD